MKTTMKMTMRSSEVELIKGPNGVPKVRVPCHKVRREGSDATDMCLITIRSSPSEGNTLPIGLDKVDLIMSPIRYHRLLAERSGEISVQVDEAEWGLNAGEETCIRGAEVMDVRESNDPQTDPDKVYIQLMDDTFVLGGGDNPFKNPSLEALVADYNMSVKIGELMKD